MASGARTQGFRLAALGGIPEDEAAAKSSECVQACDPYADRPLGSVRVQPKSPPAISVVVATRDRAPRLRSLLAALARQTLPRGDLELIVVDDGSTDETAAVLAAAAEASEPHVVALRSGGNGPAAARNVGWQAASAPLVAFTDDDCEPQPGWLTELQREANAHPGAIIQGRTVPSPVELRLADSLLRTKSIDSLGPWFQTCNVLYPRGVLERLAGFDERFARPFGEDADLAWRAIEAGVETHFAGEACVHHAVEAMSAVDFVRSGLRDPDEALVYKRHPALMREVGRLGIFKSQSHAFYVLALVATAAARRRPAAVLLAVPYLRLLAARSAEHPDRVQAAVLLAAYDALELLSAARGCLRHRVVAL